MGDRIPVRPTVMLPLRNPAAFLEVFFNQGSLGGVVVPVESRVEVGDEVELEIVFVEQKLVVHARGIARWRRVAGKAGLSAGIGIEFAESQRKTRDLLLDMARGKDIKLYQRGSRRFPVSIVVEYKADTVFLTDVTDNLSRDGAFIRTDRPPPQGSRIKMRLKPPGEKRGIEVDAEVVWQRGGDLPGFGVRFIPSFWGGQRKIDALIERIKHQLAGEGRDSENKP